MIIAGIVAAGSGNRMKNATPKQFIEIKAKPIIAYTIENFLKVDKIDYIVVAVNKSYIPLMNEIINTHFNYEERIKIMVVDGGKDRTGTLKNIINIAKNDLHAKEDDIIISHDGVRPFINSQIIENNIKAMKDYSVATTAIPMADSLFIGDNETGIVDNLVNRENFFRTQTPQTFKIGLFYKALNSLSYEELISVTDICSLFKNTKLPIKIIMGSTLNFKITYPDDLILAESILATI